MNDLNNYVTHRKQKDKDFAYGFDEGYQAFKMGTFLRQARELLGLTQEEIAIRLRTKKSAISRMENHAEDMSLSTLGKVATALGKKIEIDLI